MRSSQRFSIEKFSYLIHMIYESGTKPELWKDTLGAIAASLDSSKGILFTPYHAPQQGGFIFPCGLSAESLEQWATTYIELDIWAQGAQERNLLQPGHVYVDEDMAPTEKLLSSRFYTEFLSKIDIGRVCAGFVLENTPGLMATSLNVFRGISSKFDHDEVNWLKQLVPHVSRSLGIMQTLQTNAAQMQSLSEVFERSSSGVLLVTSALEVNYMNSAAKALIKRNDGVSFMHNRLKFADGGTAKKFRSWLLSEANVSTVPAKHFLESFAIPRRGGAYYVVQVSPFSASPMPGQRPAQYVLLISDPGAFQLPAAEQLIALFGLTRAQAKVALELARGKSYSLAAESLGITEDTVRSHVKVIYPKVRVSKNADLVRLVLSLGQASI